MANESSPTVTNQTNPIGSRYESKKSRILRLERVIYLYRKPVLQHYDLQKLQTIHLRIEKKYFNMRMQKMGATLFKLEL